jgi:DNA-binding CsgD family transcriptional regulator
MALSCSVKTVEFHISNILKKTGFGSRLRLAVEFAEPRRG